MKARAVISVKMNDEPRIIPTTTGARVELEIYNISVDELLSLVGQELTLKLTIPQ